MVSEKRRTSIICCGSSMQGGGSERQLLNLMRGLDRSQFSVALFLLYESGELLKEVPTDIPISAYWSSHQQPRWNWPGRVHRQQIKCLRRQIRSERIELVYDRLFHMTLITGAAVRSTNAARISTIVSPPSRDVRQAEHRYFWIKRWLLRRAYQSADRLLTVSQATADDAAQFYRIDRSRFEVIPSPIDIEMIERLRQQPWTGSPLRPDVKHLVTVGRLSREKGHDVLLRALASMKSAYQEPVELHFLGDGPGLEELERLSQQLGVREQVHFHGFHSNPYALIARANLLVHPSLYEGFPNVLMEGIACGIPMVATESSGSVRELFHRALSLPVVPVSDVDRLAKAMIEALSGRIDWLNRLEAGREYLIEHHGLSQWLDRMQRLFVETVERKRGGHLE